MNRIFAKSVFVSLALLVVFGITSCATSQGKPYVWKNLSFISFYGKKLRIEQVEGVFLYPDGSGVNRYDMYISKGGKSFDTHETISLTFPIKVSWVVFSGDGVEVKRSKTFETLDGISSNSIEDECSIWIYFDEEGDANIKVFMGNSMTSSKDLLKSLNPSE